MILKIIVIKAMVTNAPFSIQATTYGCGTICFIISVSVVSLSFDLTVVVKSTITN